MKVLIHQSLVDNFSDDRMILLSHYAKYCVRALDLYETVDVIWIVDNRKKYEIETTGSYSPDENSVYIYGKGRAFVDILRSISHELVHVKQNEAGFSKEHDLLHFDSELEDEANMFGMSLLNAYSEVMGHDIIYDN